jgi:hypothetical protein
MLLYFLTLAGNVIGRGPYVVACGDQHHTNLFLCAVGPTASGRKGSATGPVERVFRLMDPSWCTRVKAGGLSSGEGLVYEVRDPTRGRGKETSSGGNTSYHDVETDPGVVDKRLFIRQSEFYGALQNMKRTGNNLSAMLRDCWDRGELNCMTRNNPLHATNAHVSIVANITAEELRRSLTDEIDNGFANRFLWSNSRRSKFLPSGGGLFELDLSEFVTRLALVMDSARGDFRVRRDDEADEIWGRDNSNSGMYAELNRNRPGLFGIVTARAAPQVLRLALIFALLDSRDQIGARHLIAAREVWRNCEESAKYTFGEALENSTANEILHALRRSPDPLSRTQILNLFSRHRNNTEIDKALRLLLTHNLACPLPNVPAGPGRPPELWVATGM